MNICECLGSPGVTLARAIDDSGLGGHVETTSLINWNLLERPVTEVYANP